MKILYLTPNFKNYSSAYYQSDLIEALKEKSKVTLWGPGFSNFNKDMSLIDVLNFLKITEKDLLYVGHGWLSDIPLNNSKNKKNRYIWNNDLDKKNIDKLEYCAKYNFNDFKGKKICILNKEYVSLDEKLKFIKHNKFDLALSHYSNCEDFIKSTNVKFKFFPCSVNHKKFLFKNLVKKYDLCFSGLLQNPYISKNNKDSFSLRLKIQQKFFNNLMNYPINLKKNFKKKSIFWNAYSSNKILNKLLNLTNKYKKLSFEEYLDMFYSSKVTLNTLSPYNLIGPRFFESMITGSINLCEKSKYYEKIFIEFKHYIPFENNLSDFDEKFNFAISDSNDIKEIRSNAYELVFNNHTYEIRAQEMLNYINEIN